MVKIGRYLLGWGDPVATEAVAGIRGCDLAVFASPSYKGTFTGLLKLFLDQIPADGLSGTIAFAVMLGAAFGHAMAPELLLRPGAGRAGRSLPCARGLYLLETDYTSDEIISLGNRVA